MINDLGNYNMVRLEISGDWEIRRLRDGDWEIRRLDRYGTLFLRQLAAITA